MIETMDEPDEQLDLVDATDNPIGTIDRQEVLSLEESGKGYTRAVGVFLMNEQGQLWIPVRGMHKSIAPGGLDFSAGEHVGAGEDYDRAALRGLSEELNIDADPDKLQECGKVNPFPGMPYFHKIYTYSYSGIPQYNSADYTSYRWLDAESAIDLLQAGTPAKEILRPSIELLTHKPTGEQS